MLKKFYILFFSFFLLITFQNIQAQTTFFNADFSNSDLDSWTYYGYSTGLHGPVDTPSVVSGRLQIKTRDQQTAYVVTGDSSWVNYNLEFDVKIEQSLDDGSNGIKIYFYVDSVLYSNGAYFSGFTLNLKGRDGSWYARREFLSDTPLESGNSGFTTFTVGVNYHIKIEDIGIAGFNIYFNEVGGQETLLTMLPKFPNFTTSGGMIAIGGNDDLISIDNVLVTANVTGIDDQLSLLPKEFSLAQNYPNPYNPSTTISYSIPKESFVTLKIYDMLGKEVKTLVSQDESAGYYKVMFDSKGLSSGEYIYKLQAGNFSQSKKLILIK